MSSAEYPMLEPRPKVNSSASSSRPGGRAPDLFVLATVIVLCIAIGACAGSSAPPPVVDPPNFVLILVDALRRDHVGAYGYERPTTPFLDDLSSRGVLFENAYAQGSFTFVSTSTLLTSSLFPYRHLLEDELRGSEQFHMAEQNLTIAEVLQEAGYTTFGAFTNPHHSATRGFWQGFTEPLYLVPEETSDPSGRRLPYPRATEVMEAFVDWLDARESDAPFFAYLHIMDVHNPYRPPDEHRDLFVTEEGRHLYVNGKPEGDRVPSPADIAYMKSLYDAEIHFVDSAIRELFSELEQRDAMGNTLFIVTSDHGDEFMDHGGMGHGVTLEPEQVRIPLIFYGDPAVAPGPGNARRVEALVRNLDLAPTMLELAGITAPEEFEGVSLMPHILEPGSGSSEDAHSLAYAGRLRSLTTPRWHFIWNLETDEKVLYDMQADPLGLHDLVAERPDVATELTHQVTRYQLEFRSSVQVAAELLRLDDGGAVDEAMDPAILEQLRALGYIQ